jgi:DNA polymerase I
MWIFDSYHRGSIELWDRSRGSPKPFTFMYQPSFYLHLEDPHAYREMIEGLESRFRVVMCSFDTITERSTNMKFRSEETLPTSAGKKKP